MDHWTRVSDRTLDHNYNTYDVVGPPTRPTLGLPDGRLAHEAGRGSAGAPPRVLPTRESGLSSAMVTRSGGGCRSLDCEDDASLCLRRRRVFAGLGATIHARGWISIEAFEKTLKALKLGSSTEFRIPQPRPTRRPRGSWIQSTIYASASG